MIAPLVSIDGAHPAPRTVGRAVGALRSGALIAYPTDTCYALGCDSGSRKAIAALYKLRDHRRTKHLSFLCADLSQVASLAKVSDFAFRFMRAHAPGPFTFILPATREVPHLMQNKQREVGIRLCDSPVVKALIAELERPLISTSAIGEPEEDADPEDGGGPLGDPRQVKERFGQGLAMVLDAGVMSAGLSTVVSLIDDAIYVVRQGKGVVYGTASPD